MSSTQGPSYDDRRLSFGAAAAAYDQFRPTYPAAAVRWLLDGVDPSGLVVDVGAGTGALTRVLAGEGWRVLAVEPDAGMRSVLSTSLPSLPCAEGSAERLPVEEGSVAAIVAGQAWHWFDQSAASAEFARALVPGGTVGLVWNIRDATEGWTRDLDTIVGGEDAVRTRRHPESLAGALGPDFSELETATFPWSAQHTHASLDGLVRSFSYVRLRPDVDDVLRAVHELVDSHPDTAGRETFELPYVTTAYRARLL